MCWKSPLRCPLHPVLKSQSPQRESTGPSLTRAVSARAVSARAVSGRDLSRWEPNARAVSGRDLSRWEPNARDLVPEVTAEVGVRSLCALSSISRGLPRPKTRPRSDNAQLRPGESFVAAATRARNRLRSSPASGCHWTPRRKGTERSSTASIVPSSAHAAAVRSAPRTEIAWW